jgi:hypothetical protein
MDRKRYPDNWEWLGKHIRADRGDRCELCYAPNGKRVMRGVHGKYPWYEVAVGPSIKVVLTVHHLDFDPTNSHLDNLILCCQRCHNRLDKYHRRHKIKDTL